MELIQVFILVLILILEFVQIYQQFVILFQYD
jgi:hypothetical protein